MSFAAHLTPDMETGLGRWSENNFLQTIRTGRHLGRGRPVLPPRAGGTGHTLTLSFNPRRSS